MTAAANDRGDPRHAERAAAIRRQRQRRAGCFPAARDLFRDPAWDMLLDLFVAGERGRRESIASAVRAAGVTHAVGVRWLRALADAGFVQLPQGTADPDARVAITPAAAGMMYRFLDADENPPPR